MVLAGAQLIAEAQPYLAPHNFESRYHLTRVLEDQPLSARGAYAHCEASTRQSVAGWLQCQPEQWRGAEPGETGAAPWSATFDEVGTHSVRSARLASRQNPHFMNHFFSPTMWIGDDCLGCTKSDRLC